MLCRLIKKPDGSDWELGSGAFGRVVKGLRGGVQVSVESSGMQSYAGLKHRKRSISEVDSSTSSALGLHDMADHGIRLPKHQKGSSRVPLCGASRHQAAAVEVERSCGAAAQEVAIKMLFQSDQKAQEAFLREIIMLKYASRDRNVVQFYGVSIQSSGIWLITEHMEA